MSDPVYTPNSHKFKEQQSASPTEEKKVTKPDRIEELIKNHLGTITKTEIMENTTGISQTTVQRTLTDLVKNGYIAKVGAGPATAYVRI